METLIGLLKEGRPVHTGIAVFIPTGDLEGKISESMRVDKRILSALNAPNAFAGDVINGENIGKTSQEIADLWNIDHVDVPVPVPMRPIRMQ